MDYVVFDAEVYPNFYMFGFYDGTNYVPINFYEGCDNRQSLQDLVEIIQAKDIFWVGFNNVGYDNIILKACLLSVDPGRVFEKSLEIINTPRSAFRERIDHLDLCSSQFLTVDLMQIASGALKSHACRLHMPTIADLPYDPLQPLTSTQIDEVVRYNRNDTDVTWALLQERMRAVELRVSLYDQYRDVRFLSASDQKIGDLILSSEIARNWNSARRGSFRLEDIVDPRISFKTPSLAVLLQSIKQEVIKWSVYEENGNKRLHYNKIKYDVEVDNKTYRMRMGGLHSKDSYSYEKDLIDYDIKSYYPNLIKNNKLCPEHIDADEFITAYSQIIRDRFDEKFDDPVRKQAYKIVLNSTFGKTGSPYSWLFDPKVLFQITLNGQLYMLHFIDMLVSRGVKVVSSNTDGVTVASHPLADEAAAEFEALYGFELERAEFEAFVARDISNYLAKYKNGEYKTRGIFNPDTSRGGKGVKVIIPEAAKSVILDNADAEEVVKKCRDIRLFIDYFRCSKKYQLFTEHREVGKTARWYYAMGGDVLFKAGERAGNMAITQMAGGRTIRLIPTLPDEFPDDIDYEYYVGEVNDLVAKIRSDCQIVWSDRFAPNQLAKKVLNQRRNDKSSNLERALTSITDEDDAAYCANQDTNRLETLVRVLTTIWRRSYMILTRGDLDIIAKELVSSEDFDWEEKTLEFAVSRAISAPVWSRKIAPDIE